MTKLSKTSQNLPQDLVQPSSVLREFTHTRKRRVRCEKLVWHTWIIFKLICSKLTCQDFTVDVTMQQSPLVKESTWFHT